jgi:hypothetical protein
VSPPGIPRDPLPDGPQSHPEEEAEGQQEEGQPGDEDEHGIGPTHGAPDVLAPETFGSDDDLAEDEIVSEEEDHQISLWPSRWPSRVFAFLLDTCDSVSQVSSVLPNPA